MNAVVLRGDARALPLPDASVDLIVTSPPYFGLRSYTDGGEHYDGQIGSEATPAEWLAALVECTREWMRVLKPQGSLFVNLGDKYAAGHGGSSTERNGGYGANLTKAVWENSDSDGSGSGYGKGHQSTSPRVVLPGTRPKSLLGLPWRYALACTDQLGLILRRDIIWCLSGGARVYARTPTGDRPVMLRDLVRSYQPGNIQLWNGQRWTQVLGWNRSPDRDGALELELRTGERIGCTPGHRWPTQRGVIRADEIRIGDVISTTRLPEPDKPRRPGALDDDDIGWLIGLYMAEGSRSEKMIQFAGHAREDARHIRLRRIAQAYDGQCAVYPVSEHGVTCNLSGSVLLGIIDRYVGAGRTARNKRLRHTVWQRRNEFLEAIAQGYLEGDGHYDAKNDRWRLGFTQNDEWAADLRTLASRLGVKLSLRRHDHMFAGRTYPGWRGEWRWTRSAHHNARQDGEVVAIRSSRAREFYDVGVADDPHLFALASGVLTHNSKPNGLPESVTDRCRSSHEYVFHLVRQPRYYAAVDEIREPHNDRNRPDGWKGRDGVARVPGSVSSTDGLSHRDLGWPAREYNPLGKLPGSVWTIPSQPLTVPPELGIDHFAAFPMELPRRLILGWSPPGVCTGCGEGRRPVVDRTNRPLQRVYNGTLTRVPGEGREDYRRGVPQVTEATITGYACACTPYTDHPERRRRDNNSHSRDGSRARSTLDGGAREWAERLASDCGPVREYDFSGWTPPPTRPAVVLDPFGGTGTTALVAAMHGRTGVTIDRSADYSRLAAWRTSDPAQRAAALQVPKPPPVPDGQDALFAIP